MGNFNNGGFSPSNTVVTDLEVDEGTISVDTANNFVGIGTTTPKSDLTIEGTITVKERAAAKDDTAAYGQLWVKSDAPTSLYFTTDAGSDIQITSGTGLAGVAGSLSGLGSTDNVLLRANGTGGETAQGSGISIDDSNNVSGMGTLGCGAITTTGDITFGNGATIVNDSSSLLTITEAEILLPTTSKLSFHDTGGGENIVASADGHLEVNAGTTLDMSAPTLDFNATTKIQLDTPTVQLFSGLTNKPLLSLECTHPDANGGTFQFVKNGASVADNDEIGTIKFVSEDDGSVVHTYSTIVSTIDDMTGGEESGKLTFSVASHDGGIEQGLLLAGGSVDAEVDVTLGNGTASVTAVVGNLTVGDDLSLTTDSAVLNMGVGNDITFTHDGTTGLTIAATPISIDSTGELHLNSTTGDIKLQVGGTDQIAFDLDGTGGEVIVKTMVDNDDFVLQQYDGVECARVLDKANAPTNANGLKSGLGFRYPAYDIVADGSSTAVTLTAADSGADIGLAAIDDDIVITLPTGIRGMFFFCHVDVAVASGKTIKFAIANSVSTADEWVVFNNTPGAGNTTIAHGAGGHTLTIPATTAVGGFVKIRCLTDGDVGGNETWVAECYTSVACTAADS
jgi:hypothetical protein